MHGWDIATSRSIRFAFILALAATLRVIGLGHKSLWVDEAASVLIAKMDWGSFVHTLWQGEGNMVLYYLLLRAWIHIGDSEFIVRLLSVLAALVTLPVIYILGKRLFGESAAWISTLLLAVNACHIAYSQEARSYGLLMLLVALSNLYFLKCVESRHALDWSLYTLLTLLAIHTHFFAVLLLPAQWLALLWLPPSTISWEKLGLSILVTILLITPAAFFVLTKEAGQVDFIPHPGIAELYHLGLFLTAQGGKAGGVYLFLICLSACLVGVLAALHQDFHRRRSLDNWHYALVLSWLLVPVLLVYVISLRKEIFYYRYLTVCLPAWILLAAHGMSRLRARLPLFILLWTALGLSLITDFAVYFKPREDWRAATDDLLSCGHARDAVLFHAAYGVVPYEYYRETWKGVEHPAILYPKGLPEYDDRVSLPDSYNQVCVVLYPGRPQDPVPMAFHRMLVDRYRLTGLQDFNGIQVLHYSRRIQGNQRLEKPR